MASSSGEIGGIISAVAGLGESVYGMFQRGSAKAKQNRKERDLEQLIEKRPIYTSPSQIDEILNLRKSSLATDTKMPGLDLTRDRLGASTSQAVKNIQQSSNSVAATLGATSNVYKSEMSTLADLDVKGQIYSAAKKQALEDAYAQALQNKADYVDKAWNWNTGQKYGEQYNLLSSEISQASAEAQSGMNTIMQGGGNMAKGAFMVAGGDKQQQ
jgi:hypothetical protein